MRRVIILVAVVLAIFFSLQGFLSTLIAPFSAPLVAGASWISDTAFWWRESGTLTPEALQDLYDDRVELAIDRLELEKLKEENELLRQELRFIERSGAKEVAAQVLAKSVSHSVSRFLIDVGAKQGIQLGSAVVSGEGVYVGKVIELNGHSATVSALTDPTHSLAVSLLNESRTIGVANGTVGDLLQIDFIPTDQAIQENDLVVTSGLEALVPSGLLVGVVNTVEQQMGSPFQQAIVEPLSDIRRLSLVLVLIPPDPLP